MLAEKDISQNQICQLAKIVVYNGTCYLEFSVT